MKAFVFTLATAFAVASLCPAFASDNAEASAGLLAEANKAFDKRNWSNAEKAFLQHAKETKDKPSALRAKLKAGICRFKMNNEDGALGLFREITENISSAKVAPDVLGDAFDQSHLIYTRQKKTVNRAKPITDCCRVLPDSPATGRICEREADAYLCDKAIAKAAEFYSRAGAGLSPCGTNILMLLSLPKSGELNAAPLSGDDAKRLAAVLVEREKCGLVLCDILSKSKDGWRAQDVLARMHAAKGLHREAVAIWDSLIKARQGPAEEMALACADTIANAGLSADAAARYATWLDTYPHSKLRERASARYTSALWSACRFAEAVKEGEAFLAAYPKSGFRKPVQDTLKRAQEDLKAEQERTQAAEEKKKNADPLLITLERAERLFEQKRYTDALREFLQFQNRQIHPLWGRAWYGYGRTALILGNTERALNAWDEVIRRTASFPNTLCGVESRYARADYFFEDLVDPAKALPDYLALRDLTPPDKRPDKALEQRIGMTLLALGRGTEAKHIFSTLKDGEVQDPIRVLFWNRFIALCDKPPPALTSMDSTRRANALREMADIHFTAEQWKLAEGTYRKALNAGVKGDDAAWCEMQCARCLAYQGDYKGALAGYDKFKRNHLKSIWTSDALLRAGVLCAGPLDNPAQASRYFKDILEMCPNGRRAEDALLHLASLTWWGGEWKEAERLHREFLRKYPQTPLREEFEEFRLPLIAKRKTPFSDAPQAPNNPKGENKP